MRDYTVSSTLVEPVASKFNLSVKVAVIDLVALHQGREPSYSAGVSTKGDLPVRVEAGVQLLDDRLIDLRD